VNNPIIAKDAQKKFDFSSPRPRPFLANLPAQIDSYEDGVARFFQWRTGLDYYATVAQIIDFVINTRRRKVVDLVTDTGTFALRLGGRKPFSGRVYSFDSNVTLLERARQRARHMKLDSVVEFGQSDGSHVPLADSFAEIVVSIFDFHRHPAEQFLAESFRVLAPEGYLLLADMVEPNTRRNRLAWRWKQLQLRYVQKKPGEADCVYYDRESLIQLLFAAGFRQVVLQGLKVRTSDEDGVFSLVTATK
jgi:ubiquinone/menaquinone biosynthesis C-methylase UbiE